MKKKIAFIINSKIYSGLENVAITIIENLKDKYEFVYVTQNGAIVEVLKEKHIPYYIIKKMSIKEIRSFIKKWKPDILHAHDYTASVICAIVKGKIPLIEHLHNNPPWLQKLCKNSIAFLYAGLRANKILTVSNAIEEEYILSKLIKRKIECIGNPVDRINILDKVNQKYEKRYDICCVARLTDSKNPRKFLQIIKNLKNEIPKITAIWVGDGELYEETIKYCDYLGIKNNVKFVGFQKNPYTYMAQSKIFMLTSDWEGFGLVVVEALTLGLPCVVSNVGGLVDIVNNKCGKLCNNIEEFISEIQKLLDNELIYNECSKNARKRAIELENSQEYYIKLNEIYSNTIRRNW